MEQIIFTLKGQWQNFLNLFTRIQAYTVRMNHLSLCRRDRRHAGSATKDYFGKVSCIKPRQFVRREALSKELSGQSNYIFAGSFCFFSRLARVILTNFEILLSDARQGMQRILFRLDYSYVQATLPPAILKTIIKSTDTRARASCPMFGSNCTSRSK